MYTLLKELTAIHSPSGYEQAIGEYIADKIKGHVDSVSFDAMGNLIAFKKGSAKNPKKLMLAAHRDELGLIVIHITDDGYIVTAPVGHVRYDAIAHTAVVFPSGAKGIIIPKGNNSATVVNDGSAGSTSSWTADNMVIDIGCSSRAEAEKLTKIGDVAVYEPHLIRLSHSRVAGHAIDDKIGCAVMMKAILEDSPCANDTYYVFTVQEEVGLRGAKPASYAVAPDWGVAFDVCGTGDIPDCRPMNVKLGGGATVKVKDSSVICDRLVVETLIGLAKENDIKYQLEILERGGTDTASMQMAGNGAMVAGISIPTRGTHTPNETIDFKDVNCALALCKALLAYEIK